MGIDALTHDLAGNLVVPATSAEWDEWVSPSATRNHVLDDPLLDWLNRYGEAHGFVRDPIEEPTDFLTFLFAKGNAFEAAVVEHLRGLADLRTIVPEGAKREERRDLAFAEATFAAMAEGVPIICQGSLRDAETRTYGGPDLLVRSDVLAELFPDSLSAEEAAVAAPDLGIGDRHYRVVDIKFSTLHLAAGGELGNSGSAPAYKAQVFIYNRALGEAAGLPAARGVRAGAGLGADEAGRHHARPGLYGPDRARRQRLRLLRKGASLRPGRAGRRVGPTPTPGGAGLARRSPSPPSRSCARTPRSTRASGRAPSRRS